MNEFTNRIDRLTERLRRDTAQCDQVEERAGLVEQRLSTLQQSVQMLTRLIEVSLVIIVSSEKDKLVWIECIDNETNPMNNPLIEHFFYRLESSLHRSIVDCDEKQAYIQALSLVRKPSIVSSRILSFK
jgi:hypothetical protein